MKKRDRDNLEENEPRMLLMDDPLSDLPPPVPLDSLPDPLEDPKPVKKAAPSEEAEEKSEVEPSDPERKRPPYRMIAIVATALLCVGGLIWIRFLTPKKNLEKENDQLIDEQLYYVEDGTLYVRNEYGADYVIEVVGTEPDEVVDIIEYTDFVQVPYAVTQLQVKTMQRVSLEAFSSYWNEKPEEVNVNLTSREPLGYYLISNGPQPYYGVSSIAMIYRMNMDILPDPQDPDAEVEPFSLYWCVEFPGVFADGTMLESVYSVQTYSSIYIDAEGTWSVPGFPSLDELLIYLTGQGHELQVQGLDDHDELEKCLVDKPQWFSSIQKESIEDDIRKSLPVEILTEMSAYADIEMNMLTESNMYFVVYTDDSGRQRNIAVPVFSVHVLDHRDAEDQIREYYRTMGVMDLFVGAEQERRVYWDPVNDKVDLTGGISLVGFESEEALLEKIFEYFPDAQVWKIDMYAPRHIAEVVTPPTQKS